MTSYRILNLGAGVQSSCIYCLMCDGEIETADYALFADTHEEPQWVYDQVEMLRELGGPPIITVSAGRLGEDLRHGKNTRGGRFASIPAFTTAVEGTPGGMTRRQCTRDYKIDPIEKWIRYDLLQLQPKQRAPKDSRIVQLFGFSTDEPQRAVRMRVQYGKKPSNWQVEFPLFADDVMMTRNDCQVYMRHRFSGVTWRSSRCVFCPMQQNKHWLEIKRHDRKGFERAVYIDEQLRVPGNVVNRKLDQKLYVHRSCVPLTNTSLNEGQSMLFETDDGCDDGCFL